VLKQASRHGGPSLIKTECNQKFFSFHALGKREVMGLYDGGRITSDGGGLLLRETEQLVGVIRQFGACVAWD
jgi:hypothetical protein